MSSYPQSIELGANPAILLHAHTIKDPSLEQLRAYIEDVKNQLASPTPPASQYIFATQVSASLFTRLKQEPDPFKGVRATILHGKHQVLYKVVASVQHEVFRWSFGIWLNIALIDMRLSMFSQDYWFRGAGRVDGRIASKEPDMSFVPGNRSAEGASAEWPSLILEVRVSESMPQLRTNAQWWYSNSDGQTQLVVLIHTDSDNTDIEIWTEVDNTQPRMHTRARPGKVLRCTQHIRLENRVVHGAPLKLDFETLMRRPPRNNDEKDVELTAEYIQKICAKIG
jgi:hypothetical protein